MARGNPALYYRSKGTPQTAFSTVTRSYLRRRVVRYLRVLGDSGDPALFIPLATGVLVSFDDEVDKPLERSSDSYQWDEQARRYVRSTIWHPRYATSLGFLWLMRGAGNALEMNRMKTGWRFRPEMRAEASERAEPFAALWDQAPDAVMHLLRHARSAEVQQFALRIWRSNPGFIDEADNAARLAEEGNILRRALTGVSKESQKQTPRQRSPRRDGSSPRKRTSGGMQRCHPPTKLGLDDGFHAIVSF